jgi:hypothetical protein
MKPPIITHPSLGTFLALPIALFACASASAQLSVESFNGYTVGSPVTSTTPSPTVAGYTGNWTGIDFGTQWPTVSAGSLNYTGAGYANSTGNHIGVPNDTTGGEITSANSSRMYRLLDSSLAVSGATSGTLYLSWLFQSGQETGATTYQMLDLYNGNTANASRTFTAGLTSNGGLTGNQYDFGVNEAYNSTGVNANTGVHLFVVKFNLSAVAASDSVTLWLDPTLGGTGDPAGGTTVSGQNIAFDRLAISDYDGNSANWSDIRWGTTINSVTAVPEPSTFALASLGGLALLFRRKQNRA